MFYRVTKNDFEAGSECLGVFNTDRSPNIHATAIQIGKNHKTDVFVELCVNQEKDIWHDAGLIGDFGMVYFNA